MKKRYLFSGLGKFLILWGSQAVSALGTAMTNFALIVWVYAQKGTASSIALLSVCSYLPYILFCFIAGTIADRWDKKRIMLFADAAAALGTVSVLALYLTASLQIWHLYVINFILSFMNAFQSPASYVATTLLTPKEHYVRAAGLQALSGSAVAVLAPALGSALLAFGGLESVLAVDLATFAVAFLTLLFFIKLPPIARAAGEAKEAFVKSCTAGLAFLREHGALLRVIAFFAFINLIAKMGGYGMLPALILGRTGGDNVALGVVESAVGLGTLVGSVLVTLGKPAKKRMPVIFWSCGLSFLLGDVAQGLLRTTPLWVASAFAASLPLAFLNANLAAVMRDNVPLDMQGRVFSARDTLQYGTMPLGLFLGGMLADKVLEPFMAEPSFLSPVFGMGKGAGVAVMFVMTGALGFAASMLALRDRRYSALEK